MFFSTPNLVTWLRIILIPLIVGVFYLPDTWLSFQGKNIAATAIFIFAGITDWLDGYLARKLDQVSAFGAFLDPVADKLMVVGALIMLLDLGRVHPVVALIIIGREIAISALREWMASVGQSKSVAVAFVGKLKTVSQMIAIPLLLFHDPLFAVMETLFNFSASANLLHQRLFDCQWLGTILINVSAVLTVISMLYYLRKAMPHAAGKG